MIMVLLYQQLVSLPLSLVPHLPLLLCRSEADCVDATTFPVASETERKKNNKKNSTMGLLKSVISSEFMIS